MTPARALARLARVASQYGGDAGAVKLGLLAGAAAGRCASPRDLLRLHEVLCFLRAYPDDAAVLARVEALLSRFDRRADVARWRSDLANSGIAGTPIHYAFYWPTALWLASRWPERLTIDWAEFEGHAQLARLLRALVPHAVQPAVDNWDLAPRAWLARLAGRRETDAALLVRRFAALPGSSFTREALFEGLELTLRLAGAAGGPARTSAKPPQRRVAFQRAALRRERPDLRRELARAAPALRPVTPAAARRLIDLAREAMVSRSRDLDAFAYADPRDVRLADCGAGLQCACFGLVPERRLLLECVYGLLLLHNGVPIGYVLTASLFRSSEVAFNIFETYRGGESAHVLARVLALARSLFGSRSFSIDPYQLGHDNDEALGTGAWWFYYKLGFRPEDPGVRRVLRRELQAMRADPSHRSTRATLARLADAHLHLDVDQRIRTSLGRLDLGRIGLAVAAAAVRGFGDLSVAEASAPAAARRRLGVGSMRGWTSGERLAFARASPLLLALPGVERWSAGERRSAVLALRAKGGRRESEFVRRFDGHPRLARAVLALAGRA